MKKNVDYTYGDLINDLVEQSKKNPDILNQSVTVFDGQNDEYHPVNFTDITTAETNDILDSGHFVIGF